MSPERLAYWRQVRRDAIRCARLDPVGLTDISELLDEIDRLREMVGELHVLGATQPMSLRMTNKWLVECDACDYRTSVPSTPDNIVSDLQRLGVAHVADVLDGTR